MQLSPPSPDVPMALGDITPDDIARTKDRLIKSVNAEHGITLSPQETARVVAMLGAASMQALEALKERESMMKLMLALLFHMDNMDMDISIPAEALDNDALGFGAEYTEDEKYVKFIVRYPVETEEEDEPDYETPDDETTGMDEVPLPTV